MTECRARQPGGVLRCEAVKGHDRNGADHWAWTGDTKVTWPSRRGDRVVGNRARGKVNAVSGKQQYRQGRLAGIRDERLHVMRKAYEGAVPILHEDGNWRPPAGPSWCQHCHRLTPPERLQLHHYTQRSLGTRATPDSAGTENPEELGLICQGPGSCHDAEHD